MAMNGMIVTKSKAEEILDYLRSSLDFWLSQSSVIRKEYMHL